MRTSSPRMNGINYSNTFQLFIHKQPISWPKYPLKFKAIQGDFFYFTGWVLYFNNYVLSKTPLKEGAILVFVSNLLEKWVGEYIQSIVIDYTWKILDSQLWFNNTWLKSKSVIISQWLSKVIDYSQIMIDIKEFHYTMSSIIYVDYR